jgi:hypothetical protein
MRILGSGTNNGFVGIGTNAPSSLLHLSSASPTLKLTSTNMYPSTAISFSTGATISQAGFPACGSGQFHLSPGGSPNIGIHMSSGGINFSNSTGYGCYGGVAVATYQFDGSLSSSSVLISDNTSPILALPTGFSLGVKGKSYFADNVGIGNNVPTTLLDLKRNEPTTTNRNVMLKLTNSWSSNSALNEPTILFDNGTTSTTYGTVGWSMGAQVCGGSYFRIGTYTSSTNFTDLFKITGDGAVVIGNVSTPNSYSATNTTGYSLYAVGGILTEKVKVAVNTSSDWADFVFDKNYKLTPLQELEIFINKNKHLPGIPSAQEVVDDGINVAQMDAKLLEKIEELTLYMIEMKKEINALKEENKKLVNAQIK